MHICMVLREFYPMDIRVYKEAKSLINAGHEITLLCLKKANQQANEKIHGINVKRIWTGDSNLRLGLWDMYISYFKTHPKFTKGLNDLHQKKTIDHVHVHDLFLMETALKFGVKNKIRVFCDFHENLPEAFKVWFKWRKNPLIRLKNNLFFGYERWLKKEEDAARKADHILVTVDEMKNRFINKFNINSGKITVILNSEDRDFINQKLNIKIYGNEKDFKIVYTGNIGPHRGVDTAIEAMQYLKDQPVKLFLVGRSSQAVSLYMSALIEKYALQNKVKQTGYVPFDQFYSYMKMANVNIIPHHRNEHTDNTIPHKLFQAMMTGNPVLVSTSPPLMRIVKLCNSGLVFEAGSAKSFAEAIIKMIDHPELTKTMGENGYHATMHDKWNWKTEGSKLVALLDNV